MSNEKKEKIEYTNTDLKQVLNKIYTRDQCQLFCLELSKNTL